MAENNLKKKYRLDIIVTIIIAAAGAVIALLLLLNAHSGKYVSVNVNGEQVKEFKLSDSIQYEIVTGDGNKNLLIIEDGYAFIKEASCPDKLCVNSGKINSAGQSIVCLPNKVVIEIHDESVISKQEPDTVIG